MEELLLRAVCAGLLIAALAGPLGCFVVWQRMAYFGDTLAHSALLGIGLSLLIHIPLGIGVLLCAIIIALLLSWLHQHHSLPMDALLGILAHVSLAAGVIVLGFVGDSHIDWLSYLFGDLLAVTWGDLIRMACVAVVIGTALLFSWRKLLIISIDPELAEVDGIAVSFYRSLLLVLMAATIATAIQVVGVLLVTALLIIPATAARNFSGSPSQMALSAIVIGCLATVGGVAASYTVDVSVGPAIVLVAFLLFVLSLGLRSR